MERRPFGVERNPESEIELTPEAVSENPTGVAADDESGNIKEKPETSFFSSAQDVVLPESVSVEQGGEILRGLQSIYNLPEDFFEGFTPEQKDDFISYLQGGKGK